MGLRGQHTRDYCFRHTRAELLIRVPILRSWTHGQVGCRPGLRFSSLAIPRSTPRGSFPRDPQGTRGESHHGGTHRRPRRW